MFSGLVSILLIIFLCFSFDGIGVYPSTLGLSCVNVVLLAGVHRNMAEVHQNVAEVHQKYDFIDSTDPFWDGSPYIAGPTDKPCFVEYAKQVKTTEVLFLFPILLYLKHHSTVN